MQCYAVKLHCNLFTVKWFKQLLRNTVDKNHSPLSTLFTLSICCSHLSITSCEKQCSGVSQSDILGSWQLVETHVRTCNCSLITPWSSSHLLGWYQTQMNALMSRASLASCRELCEFRLWEWDLGACVPLPSTFSFLERGLKSRQFVQFGTRCQILSCWTFLHS